MANRWIFTSIFFLINMHSTCDDIANNFWLNVIYRKLPPSVNREISYSKSAIWTHTSNRYMKKHYICCRWWKKVPYITDSILILSPPTVLSLASLAKSHMKPTYCPDYCDHASLYFFSSIAVMQVSCWVCNNLLDRNRAHLVRSLIIALLGFPHCSKHVLHLIKGRTVSSVSQVIWCSQSL